MYCTCRSKGKTTAGYTRQADSDLWVCGKCGQPTPLVFEKVTDMLVPAKATALLSVRHRADGISECTFSTPEGRKVCLNYHPYPRKVGMDQGRELLLKTWRMLDNEVDLLHDPSGLHTDYHKTRARALAEVLANFMPPFFNDADDIVREAVKRYKARQAGTAYETPGLAEEVWDPTKNWDGTDRTLAAPAPKASATKLTDEQEAGIKNALASGAFTPEQLADMFKVPVSAVKALA